MSDARTVLVVDDSALMRAVLRDLIDAMPGFTVIGTAADGHEALDAARALKPDVITLDVEMPGLGGLETLERLMRAAPRPVVMLSGADTAGSVDLTLRALDLGALDFVKKGTAMAGRPDELAPRLEAALRAAAGANVAAVTTPTPRASQAIPTPSRGIATAPAAAVIAIAASTGGPRALAEFVAALPPDCAGAVCIAQHMPRGFTTGLARRLAELTPLAVREARDGELVVEGTILIAPGGRHLSLERTAAGPVARLDDGPTVWGVRPSADKLLVTAASCFGAAAAGVVLTGMGRDGALGLSAIREAGGGAFVQDEASCAVYGMPREALALAGADQVADPARLAAYASSWVAAHQPRRRVAS